MDVNKYTVDYHGEQERETIIIWKKLKITVEQPFQRDWLEKEKKQLSDKSPSDFL